MNRIVEILKKALLIIPIVLNAIKRILGIIKIEECECGKEGCVCEKDKCDCE